MDQEREKFLNLLHFPARMNVEEIAKFLGVSPHDIPVLVANGLLKPLGNPVQSSVKFFATVTLQAGRRESGPSRNTFPPATDKSGPILPTTAPSGNTCVPRKS